MKYPHRTPGTPFTVVICMKPDHEANAAALVQMTKEIQAIIQRMILPQFHKRKHFVESLLSKQISDCKFPFELDNLLLCGRSALGPPLALAMLLAEKQINPLRGLFNFELSFTHDVLLSLHIEQS